MPHDTDHETVRAARQRYFDSNGLGEGGYEDRWVKFKVGPVPFAFPNTAGRVRAVRAHDVHHLVTGYATDVVGEGEIGAWEIASGCHDHRAARILDLLAWWGGMLLAPKRIYRAFMRGRGMTNLYASEWDEAILERNLGELRRSLEAGPPPGRSPLPDRAAFAGWAAMAALAGIGPTALVAAALWVVFT